MVYLPTVTAGSKSLKVLTKSLIFHSLVEGVGFVFFQEFCCKVRTGLLVDGLTEENKQMGSALNGIHDSHRVSLWFYCLSCFQVAAESMLR